MWMKFLDILVVTPFISIYYLIKSPYIPVIPLDLLGRDSLCLDKTNPEGRG